MIRALMLATSLAALTSTPVLAQETQALVGAPSNDLITDRYMSYFNALQAGELEAAEAAAVEALAAAQQRSAMGGSSGVLAANLAQVRIDQGKLAEAREPAQQLHAIVERRGADAGVDPLYARLLLAQANLESEGGVDALHDAIDDARENHALDWESYKAARMLGDWSLRQFRHRDAERAFGVAVALAEGADQDADVARAEALVGRGVAQAMRNRNMTARLRTGTRLAQRPDRDADAAFVEAIRLMRPHAEREARAGGYTRAQIVYGDALAWAHARRVTLRLLGWLDPYTPDDMRSLSIDLNATDGVGVCRSSLRTTPPPEHPSEEIDEHGATTLVARFVTDGSGAVVDSAFVGSTGSVSLVRAALEVLPQWDLAATGNNCSLERVLFQPVRIMIEDEMVPVTVSHGGGSPDMKSDQTGGTGGAGWMERYDRGIIAIPTD